MRSSPKKELTIDQINEYRSLHITASALFPLLEKRQEIAYQKLIGKFRSEGSADLALVAECNSYTTLIEEINGKLNMYERLSKEK